MAPRPVVVITSSYPSGPEDPSGHFVRSEAFAIARTGIPVVVLAPAPERSGSWPAHGLGTAPSAPGTASDAAVDAGVATLWLPHAGAFGWPGAMSRLRRHPWRMAGALKFIYAARRALLGLDPARVIAHWLVPCGWPIAAASPAPLEVVVHGSDARLLLATPAVLRCALVRRLVAQGIRFRFVSQELRETVLAATVPELEAVSRVAPCALEVEGVPGRAEARAVLGVAPEARLLVVVGRLVKGKRADAAIAASLLVPAARVWVIGDGPERTALERRFPEARFLGSVSRSRCLASIAAADALVSASREEGAPTAVREARALGVPVIAAPSGDLAAWARRDSGLFVLAR